VEDDPLPPEAYQQVDLRPPAPRPDLPPLNRIQPELAVRIANSDANAQAEVIITFAENLTLPPYPQPRWYPERPVRGEGGTPAVPEQSSDNRLSSNDPPRSEDSWLQKLYKARIGDYRELTVYLRQFGAEVVGSYGLIRALRVKMPLRQVRTLVQASSMVRYVELLNAGERPPTGISLGVLNTLPDDLNAIDEARECIGLTGFPVQNLTRGQIALLDTGVLTPDPGTQLETLLSRVQQRYECTGIAAPPDDLAHPCVPGPTSNLDVHGSFTAAVLTAVTNDPDFQGVTDIPVDCYAVYSQGADGTYTLDPDAAVRAFETIVDKGIYSVVVASIQGKRLAHNAISTAADRAFDAGLVVVAANGNTRGASREAVGEDYPWWTTSPANGHKVIGAGAFDLTGGRGAEAQSFDVDDGRIKPDIQGPTNYRTLPAPPATPDYRLLETSGASPMVGGTATLLRAWLAGLNPPTYDAGQVYARLILAGQKVIFGADAGQDGAGHLYLPGAGPQWWGKVAVNTAETVTIILDVPAEVDWVDAACWWPEPATLGPTSAPIHAPHNEIWLELVEPGKPPASSWWHTSVFQRVRLYRSGVSGQWQLKIEAQQVPTNPPQTVYWAAYGHLANKGANSERDINMSNQQNNPTTGDPSSRDPDSHLSDWVELVRGANQRTGHAVYLQGYITGKYKVKLPDNSDVEYFRLYLEPSLSHYLEIPCSAVIYITEMQSDLAPLELKQLWIEADAAVIDHSARTVSPAYLLNGPISREYGGDAPVWNSPGGRPAAGGGPSLVPGCAPSSSCGSPVCPH
jgi:hypothetical protein